MIKLTDSHFKILKETAKSFKAYRGLSYMNGTYLVHNKGFIFQIPHFTVKIKRDEPVKWLDDGMLAKCESDGLSRCISNFSKDHELVLDGMFDLSVCVSNGSAYLHNNNPVSYDGSHKPIKKGIRIAILKKEDLPVIKKTSAFTQKISKVNGEYIANQFGCIWLYKNAFASDKYFAFKSQVLSSNLEQHIIIPPLIAAIICHSDKDIIVRDNGDCIEMENEYFNIWYRKTEQDAEANIDHIEEILSTRTEDVTTSKKELVESLKSIKSYMRSLTHSEIRLSFQDTRVCINGSMGVEQYNRWNEQAQTNRSNVETFTKSFTEDLKFTTYGNRFLKILDSIKGDQIKITMSKDNNNIVINDQYLLSSFMEWI